jgi:glycerophosphoryl diester phosphodiesterase
LDFQNGTEPSARGDGASEITVFLKTGIDGFFTDAADIGRAALDDYLKQ